MNSIDSIEDLIAVLGIAVAFLAFIFITSYRSISYESKETKE